MNINEALSGSEGLAGVRWALLDAQPQEALRRAVATLLPSAAMLGRCRLHRAKYKPGRHLTAYYEVSVRDAASGAETLRQIEVSWRMPGSPDPRGAMPELLAMQAAALDAGLAHPFQRLLADAPEWGMWVQVSPLDAEFPQLVRASEPRYVRTMLATSLGQGGAAVADQYAVTAIRYRPGQRHVLRYDPVDTESGAEPVFAKIYNSDKGARTFNVVARVARWLASHAEGISVAQPSAYLADDGAVLYPRVFGTPLANLLRTPGPDTERSLHLAGAAIRALHNTPLTLVELQPHSFAKEVKGIVSASEHIHTLAPATGAQIADVLRRAGALHERLPQAPVGFAYGDFKADHLWVTPDGLTLIDFDTCYLADQAIDLGKFLADLEWWHDGYELPGVEQAKASFLAGYGDLPGDLLARAGLYEVLVLVKSTARRVRLFDQDWSERTGRLIGRADDLLQRLENVVLAS
jgi:aminoglycoside phosphotransferase (APT) family kinase protein